MAERTAKDDVAEGNAPKRTRRLRPFPAYSLEDTLAIAQAIADHNAGRPYSRLSLAESVARSPEASQFRNLISASSAYGLTQGSNQAPQIGLTPLGLAIVSPRNADERHQGLISAAMGVDLFQRLYKHFDQHKLPPRDNFKNTLIRDYGIDASLADDCINHFEADGKFVGLIRTIAGAVRVSLHDAGDVQQDGVKPSIDEDLTEEFEEGSIPELRLVTATSPSTGATTPTLQSQKVFITHGSNRQIVQQLKDLLTFGKFIPIVAEEQETPSKPVPDKVMEAMRSCFAGIIHIGSEAELLDQGGQVHHKINENVLIEIGAAMALYRNNFILLVQKGIHLPPNLQGLYRCEYEGEKLDYEATMKLLKSFNEFK